MSRLALVTGASRGLGRATAVALGRRGVRCVLTARTQGGLEETDDLIRASGGPEAVLLPLDLRDGAAIDAIGPTLAQRFGRLDILVHAAAELGALTPLAHLDAADWDRVLAVDLTASWRLIRTATPLLLAAERGRALFLTHPAAGRADPFWGPLAVGKAGMEALVRTWQSENPSLAIRLVDPGPAATRFRAQAMPGEDAGLLPDPRQVGEVLAGYCL